MLFGDGAAAVVLGPDGDGEIGPILLESDGGMSDTITATHDERLLHMDGHTTFNKAVKVLSDSTEAVAARAGVASTRSTSSSTTRPTAASCAPSARSSSSPPSASPTTSARRATRPPPRSR